MKCQDSPSHISDILQKVLNNAGLPDAMAEKTIKDNWSEVVGIRIAEIAKVDSLQSGKLYLRVRDSVWKMELSFQKEEIQKRINNLLGKKIVRQLIFL